VPTYEYRCECGSRDVLHGFHDTPHVTCPEGHVMRKVFCPPAIIHELGGNPHYNHSIGRHVSGTRDLANAFARKSDEMSARMGFDVDLKPVDPRDREALGVTGVGLESTEKVKRDSGRAPATKRVIA
jgi:predicted nucleic acid-binding Zn ribbon protein